MQFVSRNPLVNLHWCCRGFKCNTNAAFVDFSNSFFIHCCFETRWPNTRICATNKLNTFHLFQWIVFYAVFVLYVILLRLCSMLKPHSMRFFPTLLFEWYELWCVVYTTHVRNDCNLVSWTFKLIMISTLYTCVHVFSCSNAMRNSTLNT